MWKKQNVMGNTAKEKPEEEINLSATSLTHNQVQLLIFHPGSTYKSKTKISSPENKGKS